MIVEITQLHSRQAREMFEGEDTPQTLIEVMKKTKGSHIKHQLEQMLV